MNQQPLKVAIVDRSPILRAGIKAVLLNQSQLELAFESDSVRECTKLLKSSPTDVVILGLRPPANKDLEQFAALRETHPEVTTIFHVREGDDVVCLNALSVGARGFLFDTFTSEEITDTIRVASRGKLIQMPTTLMTDLVRALSTSESNGHTDRLENGLVQFKPQELELLAELATGAPYKVIASRLGLAPSTIKKYAHRLITKLGASNRSDATLKASALGLLESARLA
jgi:two-component system NarL family response regulator